MNNNFTSLAPEQVSLMLGISVYTLRKLVKTGVLPHTDSKRKQLAFDMRALSKWLAAREKEACHA
ncbi:hypothetical protein AGMMS49991_00380 [Spirochaetia bacterium]|nr:hypothetical protein AGMMS49991_00380 [Spirochaetia bacterium]